MAEPIGDLESGRGSRRAPAPQHPLDAEVVRSLLLADLKRRFEVPVTLVVAGAGFGKSTLLAQAIRANEVEPRGVDAWLSCEPGDEDATRFSRAVASALEGREVGRDPLTIVLDAFRAASPVDICLVLDDVHELAPGSSAMRLLSDLVRRLPPHAHLLLSSREPPPLPLARVRAAGGLVELGADRMAFEPAEAEELARLHGCAPARIEGLGGWPSLVRLALSAPRTTPTQFLWEEIVDDLAPAERSALVALATLGWGTDRDVLDVAGAAVDLDRLAAGVPLVYREHEVARPDDSGGHDPSGVEARRDPWTRVHHLWEDAVDRTVPTDELHDIRERALRLLQGRGETVRVGWRALRWGDAGALQNAARALVRETFGALPIDTATAWLADAPSVARTSPDLTLLDIALRHANRFDAPELDDEIDALVARFTDGEEADTEGQAVALALGTVIAHFRGDDARLLTLATRVRALAAPVQEPVLRFLDGAVTAALAGLRGDLDGGLRALESLPIGAVPPSAAELVTRLHVSVLTLAGRADEAVAVGEPILVKSSSEFVRGIPPLLRWANCDPSGYLTSGLPSDPPPETNARDRFFHAAHAVSVYASVGDRDAIERVWPSIRDVTATAADARDSAIAAIALATRCVVEHDEPGASEAIERHLSVHPLSIPLSEVHLRRSPAVAYVCSDTVRRCWDESRLGPTQERMLDVARAFVTARHRFARNTKLPAEPLVLTSLPLPWSVELAARAETAGSHDGRALVRELEAWAPDAVTAELQFLAASDDDDVRAGADLLLELAVDSRRPPLRIEVLGPVRLLLDGTMIEPAEMRRARVRELLVLLTFAGPIRRERVMDLFWPDLDPSAAARNLRVTLTRLRSMLEPGRVPGRDCLSLRADTETIALAGPPRVNVDLWELRHHLAAADDAHADAATAIDHLDSAVALWRGDPLEELQSFVEFAGDVEHVRQSLVDATLRVGEYRLVEGRFDEAIRCADRARRAAPYGERAYRLAIAANLQRHDLRGVRHHLRDLEHMLDDARVEPAAATSMLVRQARDRLATLPV